MSFTNVAEVIGTSDNEFYQAAVGFEASIHTLFIDNTSGSSETISIKLYNQITATTVTIQQIVVPAGTTYTFPKPIDLAQQDKIILSSSGTGSIATLSVYSQSISGVVTSISLTPRGIFDVGAAYSVLDIVDYLGSSYVAITGSTGSTPPSVNWGLIAQAGGSAVILDTTPQLGGDLDCNSKTINTSSYRQITAATPGTGTTHTFDYLSGDMQEITAPAAGTLTLDVTGLITGKICAFVFDVVNGGNCTISFQAGWKFAAGTVPTFTAAGTDRLMLLKDSSDVVTVSVIATDIKVTA